MLTVTPSHHHNEITDPDKQWKGEHDTMKKGQKLSVCYSFNCIIVTTESFSV